MDATGIGQVRSPARCPPVGTAVPSRSPTRRGQARKPRHRQAERSLRAASRAGPQTGSVRSSSCPPAPLEGMQCLQNSDPQSSQHTCRLLVKPVHTCVITHTHTHTLNVSKCYSVSVSPFLKSTICSSDQGLELQGTNKPPAHSLHGDQSVEGEGARRPASPAPAPPPPGSSGSEGTLGRLAAG